ncbi:MAG: MATE family efflux transporter, partial [Plesiomonas shigelloides]
MILSNITVPLLGLVDTAVMGHLDNAVYLSAVAVGSMVITFITMMFNFLRMSTTGMTAQAYGADNQTAIARALLQPLLLGLLIGLGLWLLRTPLTAWGLELSGAQGELAQQAHSYLALRFWAAPATLANLVLLGWLLGMQHMKAPVLLLVWGNLLNIVLDIYLVWYVGWQVRGAA